MVIKFLPLSDLSVYIDLTDCFEYSYYGKVLRELGCYLEKLSYPKVKTLYVKYETLLYRSDSHLESFLTSLSESINFIELDEFTFEVVLEILHLLF